MTYGTFRITFDLVENKQIPITGISKNGFRPHLLIIMSYKFFCSPGIMLVCVAMLMWYSTCWIMVRYYFVILRNKLHTIATKLLITFQFELKI